MNPALIQLTEVQLHMLDAGLAALVALGVVAAARALWRAARRRERQAHAQVLRECPELVEIVASRRGH